MEPFTRSREGLRDTARVQLTAIVPDKKKLAADVTGAYRRKLDMVLEVLRLSPEGRHMCFQLHSQFVTSSIQSNRVS